MKSAREIFPKIAPVKLESMPVKKNHIFPREIENKSYFFRLMLVKTNFLTVRKKKKHKNVPVKKKSGREKAQILVNKWA